MISGYKNTLLLATLASLLTCGGAYQPGGISPSVKALVNFGLNPFVEDCVVPGGFCQLPGFSGATVDGNILTATTADPGLFMSNSAYDVPGLGSEMEVRGSMAFQAEHYSGPIYSPVGFDIDPLYGVGQLGFFDPTSGWLFANMMTNLRIYALYARLPIARTQANDYAAFAYLVPIADRSKYASNDLSVVLNKAHYAVSWRIQGVERLLVERVGTPIDSRFMLADDGGLIQCMGFPDSVHSIIGFGMLPNATQPYTACQSPEVFDQCIETIMEAESVCCDYQPFQPESTYGMNLTLTIEYFSVLEWRASFDCQNAVTMNVACIRPEPLCFNNCQQFPVMPSPPTTGCGLRVPALCSCSSSSESSHHCNDCPEIYRACESSGCTSSDCPYVYRPARQQRRACPRQQRRRPRACSSSSSSAAPVCTRKPQQRRCKSSSSSSSSSSSHCKPFARRLPVMNKPSAKPVSLPRFQAKPQQRNFARMRRPKANYGQAAIKA